MPRQLSPEQLEINELKKEYYRELHNAQARYRYYARKETPTLAYQEALNTGGQFSFRGITEIGQFYAELARIRQFAMLEANTSEIETEVQHARAKRFLEMFTPGISEEERLRLGLDPTMKEALFRVYRKLEEEAPGLINYGGVFSSEEVISYLYNEMQAGYSEDEVQEKGHNLLEAIRAKNPNFINDIPRETLLRYRQKKHYVDVVTDEDLAMYGSEENAREQIKKIMNKFWR